MVAFDVFNGDADGICALHMLRMVSPRESTLITGIKRDIALLDRVTACAGDMVTVLDISLDQNRKALLGLLDSGASVAYFDHHFAGEVPQNPRLAAHIDTAAAVCTSLIVDRVLQGRHRPWAVVAAFGDNLAESARAAAADLALGEARLAELQSLGECLNYNGYGEGLEDLYFDPAELYRIVHRHADPFALMREEPAYRVLRDGYAADMALADAAVPLEARAAGAVFLLPDAAWSRRVSGVFGNVLARRAPHRAHAVLTPKGRGGYLVSVRAPLAAPSGADDLCRRFPTGGGRKAAAGINDLPESELDAFASAFFEAFGGRG